MSNLNFAFLRDVYQAFVDFDTVALGYVYRDPLVTSDK